MMIDEIFGPLRWKIPSNYRCYRYTRSGSYTTNYRIYRKMGILNNRIKYFPR